MSGTRETEAERMTRHRQEFAEAIAHGISILDLRRQKAAERQALRHRAHWQVADHTADLMEQDSGQPCGDFRQFDAHWMMRD